MFYSLTPAQKKQWLENGFVIVRDFFEDSVKMSITEWCNQLTAWPESPGKWMKYFEKTASGEHQLCRVENFLDYHKGMDTIARSDRTLRLIADLMDEPAVIFKEKINYKFAGAGGFAPHQDAPAFLTFKQHYHITMMVAIDDCTIENGCLQLVEHGANARRILPQEKNGAIKSDICNQFIWKPVELLQGEVILFDSYLPHYSEPNHSDFSRRAMFITYNRASDGGSKRDAYYQDKREKFPPDCERIPGKDYSAGAEMYNVANPITTILD